MPTPYAQLGPQTIGTDRDYQITLVDESGNVVTTFLGSETLSATIWAGDSEASLATPTASWISAPAGTIKLAVSAANIAALAVGWYRLSLAIVSGGRTYDAFQGVLQIVEAAAAAIVPPAYTTLADLRTYAPWIEELEILDSSGGFAREQGRARSWLDDILVSRWKPTTAMPQLGQPGWGAWLMGGAGMNDPLPSKWFRDQLALNTLIVRDQVKEICAKKAIAYICDSQLGRDSKTPFQDLARRFHRDSDQLVKVLRAEIDLLPQDGFADLVVNCGATNLR